MLLRLTQSEDGEKGEHRHRVEIRLEGDGAPRVAASRFGFGLSPQDEEDLRWYLEEFLEVPQDPAPILALHRHGDGHCPRHERVRRLRGLFRGILKPSRTLAASTQERDVATLRRSP